MLNGNTVSLTAVAERFMVSRDTMQMILRELGIKPHQERRAGRSGRLYTSYSKEDLAPLTADRVLEVKRNLAMLAKTTAELPLALAPAPAPEVEEVSLDELRFRRLEFRLQSIEDKLDRLLKAWA